MFTKLPFLNSPIMKQTPKGAQSPERSPTTKDLFEMVRKGGGFLKFFENDEVCRKLKAVVELSKDWTIKQKREFVRLAVQDYQGTAAWVSFSADDPSQIFGLTRNRERTLTCLKLIAETFPELSETQLITYILSEVERIKQRQANPIYRLDQKPRIIFNDAGLKFAVINRLMYEEEKLRPKFDIDLFAEEYTARFIDFKHYGASYAVGDYFLNLDIPPYLLNQIQTLRLNRQSDLYRLAVILEPGRPARAASYITGDFVPVTDKAVEDLALLPNLREVYLYPDKPKSSATDMAASTSGAGVAAEYSCSFENSFFPPRETYVSDTFIRALKERNIKIETIYRDKDSPFYS